jgi:two-component system response regulator DctR
LGCTLPVLFLSGHGDIPMAVEAVHKGALDFIEKPFKADDLLSRLHRALEREAQAQTQNSDQQALRERLGQLTEREQEIMVRVAAGKLNKVIADELNISMRTVEVHRARVFSKMGVRSSAELATQLARQNDH